MNHTEHGPEFVRAQAKESAAARLKRAAAVIEADLESPAIKKRFTYGNTKLTARFDYPGVLKVIDSTTGETLAVSAPGRPGELCSEFVPPTPALAKTVTP